MKECPQYCKMCEEEDLKECITSRYDYCMKCINIEKSFKCKCDREECSHDPKKCSRKEQNEWSVYTLCEVCYLVCNYTEKIWKKERKIDWEKYK